MSAPIPPSPKPLAQRIADLHAWYFRNVAEIPITPEIERLWMEWFKAGYNGHDLRDVVRYLLVEIRANKRREGSLKLSNLIARSDNGQFLGFAEDLALARSRARRLNPDHRLEPAPDAPARNAESGNRKAENPAPAFPAPPSTTPAGELALAALLKLKKEL